MHAVWTNWVTIEMQQTGWVDFQSKEIVVQGLSSCLPCRGASAYNTVRCYISLAAAQGSNTFPPAAAVLLMHNPAASDKCHAVQKGEMPRHKVFQVASVVNDKTGRGGWYRGGIWARTRICPPPPHPPNLTPHTKYFTILTFPYRIRILIAVFEH